jgi:hypothetical protein
VVAAEVGVVDFQSPVERPNTPDFPLLKINFQENDPTKILQGLGLEQRVEQIWDRCFFYICSARKPLIFKAFSLVFRERNRWNRCKYTFFLLRKKYIRNVYIRNCPFYLFHAFQTLETP